jgi:autotransporter-associated beta strand protein
MYLRPRTRFAFIAFLATGATALTIPAQAQTVWVDGTGSWFVPGNWSAGVPTVATPLTTVGNGGTAQIAGAAANAGAALVINGGSTVDLQTGGSLTAGGITVSGAFSTLLLSGSTALTGPITLSGGTLQATTTGTVSDTISLSAGPSTIAAGAGHSLTLSGGITGAGAVGMSGPGTITLSGADTYSGGTSVTGTLVAGSTGGLSGNSDFTVNATGAVDLNGFNSTIGSLAGAAGAVVTNTSATAATLSTNALNNASTSYAGTISDTAAAVGSTSAGALNLIKDGSGALTLSSSTYHGDTTVNNGTLVAASTTAFSVHSNFIVGTAGTTATLDLNGFNNTVVSLAGNASGVVTNNGAANATLTEGAAAVATTFAGTIQDGAKKTALTVAAGTLTLSGTNTYSGGTTIGSSLTLGNGGTTGSIVGNVADNGTFTVNRSSAFTLDGVISGTGSFNQVGTGTTTLTAANTFAGLTTVSNGALMIAAGGSLAGPTNVTGGTLGGAGTVAGITVASGGTFAPGSLTQGLFMTLTGNLALQSGALYLVQFGPGGNTFAKVAGTAALNGTAEAVFTPASRVAKQNIILTSAGGVAGTFSSLITTGMPSNMTASLSYDAHDVFLNLALGATPNGGLNVNQQNVANAILAGFNGGGAVPLALIELNPAGLTQASGELATGSQQTTFNAMGIFVGLLTDPFVAGRGDSVTAGVNPSTGYAATQKTGAAHDAYAMLTKAPPAAPFEARWSVWAAGFGGSQTTDGNAVLGSNTATSSIFGTAVGADYRLSPDTIAGFALAGGGTNFSVANGGNGRSDLFQAGAFVRHTAGPAYISAALAYGWQDITTDRTVTIAGVDHLRAEFNANAWSGRVEGGYRFVVGGLGITPYAAGQFTAFDLPAYAESVVSGANTFALGYGAKSVTDSRSELGIRGDKSYAMQDAIFTLRSRLAWAHDFTPDASVAATFQALPGASFVVNGAARAHDSALTTVSAETRWINGWSTAVTFEGEFSDVTRSYAGKGVVRYAW